MNQTNQIDISAKFTNESFDIVSKAAELAYSKNSPQVGALHLLSILIDNQKIQEYFQQEEIDYVSIQSAIKEALTAAGGNRKPPRVIFNDDFVYLLHLAYLESERYQRMNVTIGDLLIAIMSMVSLKEFVNLNEAQIEHLSDWVIANYLGQKQKEIKSEEPITDDASLLNKYVLNLNNYLENDILEEIASRHAIEEQLMTIVTRQNKKNAVLVGENGTGRKTILYSLIKAIKSNNVPQNLENHIIFKVNVNSLISAVSSFGRGDDLIDLIIADLNKKYNGRVILFIESIDTLFDNIKNPEGVKLINALKEPISSGNIQLIATSSISGFRKNLQSDEFFIGNFESIYVEEPDIQFVVDAIKLKVPKISKHFNIKIGDGVVEQIVNLSKRYLQNKFLPEKAIDLLDEIAANASNSAKEIVDVDQVKKIISLKTGIPLETLNQSEKDKLAKLEENLASIVKGQPNAVHSISEVVKRSRAGLKDPKRPIGSFLFLGPSGVGKTYISKTLAKLVYDSEDAMVRIDMSEFGEAHTVQRLIGAPPGYVGYEEGGQLTNPIWDRPYSLILLDEIEKAHLKVFDVFLQVIDDGRLTDGQGRTVDFKNTIIIATSNIGSDDILEYFTQIKGIPTKEQEEKFLSDQMIPLLKEHFRPEFINRFDDIVIFNPLSKEQLFEIAKLEVKGIQERLSERQIVINVPDGLLVEIVNNSYNPSFGARPLKRMLQEKIENVIASKIVSGEINNGDIVNL